MDDLTRDLLIRQMKRHAPKRKTVSRATSAALRRKRETNGLKPEPGVYDEGKAQRVDPYPPATGFDSHRTFQLPKRQGF